MGKCEALASEGAAVEGATKDWGWGPGRRGEQRGALPLRVGGVRSKRWHERKCWKHSVQSRVDPRQRTGKVTTTAIVRGTAAARSSDAGESTFSKLYGRQNERSLSLSATSCCRAPGASPDVHREDDAGTSPSCPRRSRRPHIHLLPPGDPTPSLGRESRNIRSRQGAPAPPPRFLPAPSVAAQSPGTRLRTHSPRAPQRPRRAARTPTRTDAPRLTRNFPSVPDSLLPPGRMWKAPAGSWH